MIPVRRGRWLWGWAVLVWIGFPVPTATAYTPLPAVIHLHTTFGSGQYDLAELVDRARQAGIAVLIPTEHDLVAMEYGLWPLRHLIKRRVDRPSILSRGPDVYLDAISEINRRQSDVLIIPGAQSSPFYYWTGTPWNGDLTAHDYRKELLVIGMTDPDDYRGLPLLHRGWSTRYVRVLLPVFLLWTAITALGAGVWTTSRRRRWRIAGKVVVVAGLVLMANHQPFRSSRFDPYHGDAGVGPFQEVIDYTASRGGLVYWAHPESSYADQTTRIEAVRFQTPHYPDDLLAADRFAGFSALYGDTIHATDPGSFWDRALMDYCAGRRRTPVWGIAGADYHRDFNWVRLDSFQTIILAENKSTAAVVAALAAGRNYSIMKASGDALALEDFRLDDPTRSDTSAIMGETLPAGPRVRVRAQIHYRHRTTGAITARLILDGQLVHETTGPVPLVIDREVGIDPNRPMSFFRIMAKDDENGRLVSNPIFVRVRPAGGD